MIVFEISGKDDKENKKLEIKTDQEIANMLIEGNRIDMIDNWWIQNEH